MSKDSPYKEDELGELRPVLSKAEARERYVCLHVHKCKEAIHAEEDAQFFAAIDRTFHPSSV